jgi:alkylation response protein AidB-like acyl-CoA dehydrogenase
MTGISVHTDMATPSLHRFGSEELKQKYLVPAIRGEMVSAIAVTEPDAGSIGLIAYCQELWETTCNWARERKLFGKTLMSMQTTWTS